MRILVYPHLMEIGGSQLNAIELAHESQRRGNDVVLFSPPGRLVALAEGLGLHCITAPREARWPSPSNIRALARVVRDHQIDVVHGYEWGPAVELAFGPHRSGVPMMITSMSMTVPDFLPRHVPLVVGTKDLLDEQQRRRRGDVHLMEPPIDTRHYVLPSRSERAHARLQFGFEPDEIVVSVVCRLSSDLGKLAGVLTAIEAIAELARHSPVRLLAVGEGPGLSQVLAAGEAVNLAAGQRIVVSPGALDDPLLAYQAADITIGMGSSALKGMSCSRPLIVQGEHGFWRTLDEDSLPDFLQAGWWGGTGGGAPALRAALQQLITDTGTRTRLGALGRRVVEERYSLSAAGEHLESIYRRLLEPQPAGNQSQDLTRTGFELAKFKTVRLLQQHAPPVWERWNQLRHEGAR